MPKCVVGYGLICAAHMFFSFLADDVCLVECSLLIQIPDLCFCSAGYGWLEDCNKVTLFSGLFPCELWTPLDLPSSWTGTTYLT